MLRHFFASVNYNGPWHFHGKKALLKEGSNRRAERRCVTGDQGKGECPSTYFGGVFARRAALVLTIPTLTPDLPPLEKDPQ